RRVFVMASDQTHRVTWALSKEGVGLSALTPDGGDSSDAVAGEYTGEPLTISFNARYLLEMLPRVPSDTLRLTFKRPDRAVMIHPVGGDAPDLVNLIMPLTPRD